MKFIYNLLLLSLFSCSLFSETLLDKFQEANVGDFVVFAHNKEVTLLRIAAMNDTSFVIEEITALEKSLPKEPNWQNWLDTNAPYNTAWIFSTFDRKTGRLLSTYSYTTAEWIEQDPQFAFMPTLLTLPFKKVPLKDRKKIGVAPYGDERDTRKFWVPQVFFDGKEVHPPIDVFEVKWPQDSTDLSGKIIDLYFPQKQDTAPALFYFPYWVEIRGKIGRVKIRVIDSGRNLTSSASLPSKPSS